MDTKIASETTTQLTSQLANISHNHFDSVSSLRDSTGNPVDLCNKDSAYNAFLQILHILDTRTAEANYQDGIIRQQIIEIHLLKEQMATFRFYATHPKDEFLINFGHHSWRNMSYRSAVSSRNGKKIIAYARARVAPNAAAIEFLQYLADIHYH